MTPHDKTSGEPVAGLLSDIGNAARFANQHRHHLAHVNGVGWLAYDGRRWTPDDTGKVMILAKKTALSIGKEAQYSGETASNVFKWAARSQSRDKLTAMIDLAKCELAIPVAALDADPMLLNLQNGTLDLRSCRLSAHRPEDRLTKICRAAFNPGASAPGFTVFLNRIFQSNPDLVHYVLKTFGYCLTGKTTEQCLFFFHGAGANGKSTLVDTMLWVMGEYAMKAARDLLTIEDSHPTNVADLQGRRLGVVAESNDGHRFDEAKLKDLVGETTIKARRMRENYFEFPMTAKLILQSNHKPSVRGTDHGFWRRMRLVPFLETIGDNEKDPALGEKLRGEADGILNLLLAGCVEWQKDGLGTPAAVKAATAEYRSAQDTIGQFLEICCISAANAQALAGDLYKAYTQWATSAGERQISQRRFGESLAEHGFTRCRCPQNDRILWRGIGLKADVRETMFSEPSEP